MIKIFKKKQGKSEKLLIGTKEILKFNGIEGDLIQDECAHAIIKANIAIMKGIAKQHDLDKFLNKEMEKMRGTLELYGITIREQQDNIILAYFEHLGEIAGLKQ